MVLWGYLSCQMCKASGGAGGVTQGRKRYSLMVDHKTKAQAAGGPSQLHHHHSNAVKIVGAQAAVFKQTRFHVSMRSLKEWSESQEWNGSLTVGQTGKRALS